MTAEFTDLQGLAVGQVWEHKNGNIYEIYDFTNLEAGRQDEYPTTVSYRNIHTEAPYSRPVSRWAGSFKRREDLEEGDNRVFNVQVNFVHGADRQQSADHLQLASVVTRSPRKAAQLAKDVILARFPDATITYVNVTGDVVGQLKVVDNG